MVTLFMEAIGESEMVNKAVFFTSARLAFFCVSKRPLKVLQNFDALDHLAFRDPTSEPLSSQNGSRAQETFGIKVK